MSTEISRRGVLALAAANATWLVIGCAPYRNAGRGAAYRPWDLADDDPRPELLAVRAAILAASPHNTQPWRFRVTPETIDVYADHARALGPMDSLGRELFMGLGCAIENAALTARAHGREVTVTYLPDPAHPTLAARLALHPAPARTSPLEAAIAKRRTNRFPYRDKAVPATTLATLPRLIEDARVRIVVVTDPDQRRRLRQDSIDAVTAITRDTEMAEASHRWWRQTQAEIDQHRDGLNLDGLGLGTMTRWFAGRQDSVPLAQANEYWIDAIEGRQTTGAGFFLLATRDRNSVEQQLAAGRAYQRLHLWLTRLGIDAQPLNMLPEMQDREETTAATHRPFSQRAAAWLGPDGGGLQLLARFGYGEEPAYHSARRGLDEVVCADACAG